MAQLRGKVERPKDTRYLVRKLKAIRNARMRCVALAGFLSSEPIGDVVEVLSGLVNHVQRHSDPDYYAAADALSATLFDRQLVPYTLRQALYEAAKRASHPEIARLFFDASPASVNERQLAADLAPEREVVPRQQPLTLGERKSLARAHRRVVLDHVLRDPHPDVVEILLDNPHLTERDVITIAARRPILPAVLEVIAASDRWRPRYSVKRALVMNPHTPAHLAMRLATTLQAGDLRAVADDPNLDSTLRDQAAALLESRS